MNNQLKRIEEANFLNEKAYHVWENSDESIWSDGETFAIFADPRGKGLEMDGLTKEQVNAFFEDEAELIEEIA